MTLFRKGPTLLHSRLVVHGMPYPVTLPHARTDPRLCILAKVATCFMMRIKLRMNKYLSGLVCYRSMPLWNFSFMTTAEASDIIKGFRSSGSWIRPKSSPRSGRCSRVLGVSGSRTIIGICLLSGTVGFFLQAQSNLSPKSTRLAASASA